MSLLRWTPVACVFLICSARADFFELPAVKTVRIEIAEDDVNRLRDQPRRRVRAKLHVDDAPAEEVLIHVKGRGSFRSVDEKPSFTIFGASTSPKFHLNNSIEDASYLKEKLGGELFQAAGIPSPKVTHARVRLNGIDLGLYVLKEGFTAEFVERSFGSVGALYDTDQGQDVNDEMEQDLGEPAQKELKELAAAAQESNLERRFERLGAILDIGQFITFMAVEMLVCHWDGYALSKNNFRVYLDQKGGRLQFLPTGLDQIFSKADLPWKPAMSGLVAKAVMETEQGQREYDKKFRKLSEKFSSEQVSARVREIVAELRPFLSRSEASEISSEGDDLISAVRERKESLCKQLDQPTMTFPEFKNGIAELNDWLAADESVSGAMSQDAEQMQIVAAGKTAASWRKKVLLAPGLYAFSANVRASEVKALPFGTKKGAVLRVFGKDSHSKAMMGNLQQRLVCEFEVDSQEEVILICELRAGGGRVSFEKPIRLEIKRKK